MKTIRGLRQAQGWTQFELALKIGVQPQAVYLRESGRRVPRTPQLRRWGEVFGLCSDDIVLAPGSDAHRSSHRARANRRPDEPVPGRDYQRRATTRSNGEIAGDRDDGEGGEQLGTAPPDAPASYSTSRLAERHAA